MLSAFAPLAAAAATALAPAYGVATGDVTSTSALVWSRIDTPARMHVQVVGTRSGGTVFAGDTTDLTGTLRVTGLKPNHRYAYRVWFASGSARSKTLTGSFRTAPAAKTRRPFTFAFSGDLGQSYCRRTDTGGYGIFGAIAKTHPDFFVFDGDAIYADYPCGSTDPAGHPTIPGDFASVNDVDWTNVSAVRATYLLHWRYNRGDPFVRQMLATTPLYSQWDDHEVENDFGAPWPFYPFDPTRAGYPNLVDQGRAAFLDYGVVPRRGPLYRSFRWGRDAQLFLLDGRSYRSRDDLPDTAENHKTLLGAVQLAWLEHGLSTSTATWKIVSSDVALSVASSNPNARDGWASGDGNTGFERELLSLLSYIDAHRIRNVVFLATDVHFTEWIRHQGDFNGDGAPLRFYELIGGPLAAIAGAPHDLDPTTHPTHLWGVGGTFDFVTLRIAGRRLHVDARGENGAVITGSPLDIVAQ